jgi:hypothetical protein
MRAWDLITLLDPQINPQETKIHLAGWNGIDDPLDLFRAGTFDEWQAWQSRKNFERRYVVAMIQMLPSTTKWLFAGAYERRGRKSEEDGYTYDLAERPRCREIAGRLVVKFERPGRQPYLNADGYVDNLIVNEVRAVRLSVPDFPGFKRVHIPKSTLDLIVRENDASWRNALSSVSGVYLISDSVSGMFYVGSATGEEGGIWQRWCDYSHSGHGGNKELRELLKSEGMARAAGFHYSVLETADSRTGRIEVLARESHWKEVLLTRIHGLNPT